MPDRFKITEKGIRKIQGTGHSSFFKWDRIVGFTAYSDLNSPESVAIALSVKGWKRPKFMTIEQGDYAQSILEFLETRVPIQNVSEDEQKGKFLTDRQLYAVLSLTILLSIPFAVILYKYRQIDWLPVLLAGCFILGPGTFSLLIIFGRRFIKDPSIRSSFVIFNMIGFLIIMFIMTYLRLRDLAQLVQQHH